MEGSIPNFEKWNPANNITLRIEIHKNNEVGNARCHFSDRSKKNYLHVIYTSTKYTHLGRFVSFVKHVQVKTGFLIQTDESNKNFIDGLSVYQLGVRYTFPSKAFNLVQTTCRVDDRKAEDEIHL